MKMSNTRRAFILFALAGAVTGCSRSGGRREPETLEPEEGYGPQVVETRPLISQVTEMQIQKTPGGVIVKATGLADGQGYWDANLVAVPRDADASSELRLDFRVRPPVTPAPGGAVKTREIVVARTLTDKSLEGIRTITVVGALNTRSSRR